MHQLDLGGPVIEAVERIQQFFGMIGDLEKPLRQLAAFHQCAGSPATPILDLLVGQHRHVLGVPVHDGILAIDQPCFEEVEEKRLLLAVVLWITGCELTRPVDRQAQRLHLRAHVSDVVIGPIARVAAGGHRGVLGGHSESVPAHRMEDIVPRGDLVTRDYVTHRIIAHMPHVNAP